MDTTHAKALLAFIVFLCIVGWIILDYIHESNKNLEQDFRTPGVYQKKDVPKPGTKERR